MIEELIALGGPADRKPIALPTDRWTASVWELPPMAFVGARASDVITPKVVNYVRTKVAAGEATMTRRGRRTWDVLVPSTATEVERTVLWERDSKPTVDGGHRAGGRPGDGCTDLHAIHRHVCGTCHRYTWFHQLQCEQAGGIPSCEWCGGIDWRRDPDTDYADELAGVHWW